MQWDEANGALEERQRLAEAVKHHQINHNTVPEQPEGRLHSHLSRLWSLICISELLEAVRASLRAKVAALAEDNWMFEPEEQPRG